MSALTALRFVAAIWVVFFHFLTGPVLDLGAAWPVRALLAFGDLAVPFFFMLSGYVLAYTYTAADLRGRRRSFYVARFARTYPTYVLGLGLCVALSLARGGFPDPPGFLLTTVGLQSWAPGHAGSWNFPAWSLSVEFFLYAMFPALIAVGQKPRFFWPAYVATLVATLAFTSWWALNARTDYDLPRIPLLGLAPFATGIVLARARPRTMKLLTGPRPMLVLGCTAIFLMVVMLVRYFLRLEAWWTPFESAVVLALFAAVIVGAAHLERTWLDRKVFIELGEASYAVYILQVPIVVFIIGALEPYSLHLLLRALIAIPILVGVSLAVHRFFEVPARRFIRQALTSRASHRARGDAIATVTP